MKPEPRFSFPFLLIDHITLALREINLLLFHIGQNTKTTFPGTADPESLVIAKFWLVSSDNKGKQAQRLSHFLHHLNFENNKWMEEGHRTDSDARVQ
jgi:hypothetical protein